MVTGDSPNKLQRLPLPRNLSDMLDAIPRQNIEQYLDNRKGKEAIPHLCPSCGLPMEYNILTRRYQCLHNGTLIKEQ